MRFIDLSVHVGNEPNPINMHVNVDHVVTVRQSHKTGQQSSEVVLTTGVIYVGLLPHAVIELLRTAK